MFIRLVESKTIASFRAVFCREVAIDRHKRKRQADNFNKC